jgi:hypothetical protein
MLKRLVIMALLLAVLAGGAQWLLDVSVGQTATATAADDGWRRTKQGWERLSPRIISARRETAGARQLPPSSRDDAGDKQAVTWGLHPLAFVIFLALGAVAAFCLLPGGNSPLARRQSQTLF